MERFSINAHLPWLKSNGLSIVGFMTKAKIKFEIKSRWIGKVLFKGEYESMKDCLRDAVLTGADLRRAVLTGADLRGADLRGAVLRGADLRGADLRRAVLTDADLTGAVLTDDLEGVPSIPDIHKTIYEAVSKTGALEMSTWHTCETTHCRAGWVVHLAGAAGAAMEYCMGTPTAAALIYLKSDPKLEKIPDFYADNEDALADMKRLAEAA